MSPFSILVILALLFTVAAIIWQARFTILLAVAVLLISIALLIGVSPKG